MKILFRNETKSTISQNDLSNSSPTTQAGTIIQKIQFSNFNGLYFFGFRFIYINLILHFMYYFMNTHKKSYYVIKIHFTIY